MFKRLKYLSLKFRYLLTKYLSCKSVKPRLRDMNKKILKRPPLEELKKYNAYVPDDTAFQAHARLLQNKWLLFKENTKDRLKGETQDIENANLLEKSVLFLTSNIYKLVDKTMVMASREHAANVWDRFKNNLLSSQHLCFNMFGEMSFNLSLGTQFFSRVLPHEVAEVTSVVYDYSTRKGKPDWTTFDVYVEYISVSGEEKFLGIMVRYCENMKEEEEGKSLRLFHKYSEQYQALANDSGYFSLTDYKEMASPPFGEIWRAHLLCYNMSTDTKLARKGEFMVLYPYNNDPCDLVVRDYQERYLQSSEQKSKFYTFDLNFFMRTIDEIANSKWSKELVERYLVEE